jgi:hypothetical protein
MSGGGGGSGNDSGGSDMQVSGMEAAYSNEKGISTHAESRTGYTGGGSDNNNNNNNYSSQDNEEQQAIDTYNSTPDTSTVGIAAPDTGTVDSENEYDAPDRAHYNQTQKDITQAITGLGDDYQADWSDLSKGQQEQYQLEMNKVKGTEGKNYSFYAGNEGTINNTFAENWKDAVVTSPSLSKSPTLRFLMASAKTVKQNATTSYGTGDYGAGELSGGGSGTAVDKGGWLGKISSGQASQDFIGTPQGRDAMNEIAPHAPYMISGITKPTDSPAANWYANLGTTPSSPAGFNLATEYATAKAAISTKLQSRGPIGMLAVSDSPYYDWLKTNKLDKGIL